MKVLITGGAGFIGSHITEELVKENYEVVIVDNLITGKEGNIPKGIQFYQADICGDLDHIFLIEKPDYVIHQAAQVSVSNSIREPLYDGKANILGTINVLNSCVKHKIKKFIFASTAALYGSPKYLPIDESHFLEPISFYGLSKLNAEAYIKLFSKLFDLKYTILRYANVYGMRQDINGEAGVVAIFIEQLLRQQDPKIYGDGYQTRDFVFVKDVARANRLALDKGENEIINIGTQTQITVRDIVKELAELLDVEVFPIFLKERTGDIRHSFLSNENAKKALNWTPKYSFSEGIMETVSYYQKNLINMI